MNSSLKAATAIAREQKPRYLVSGFRNKLSIGQVRQLSGGEKNRLALSKLLLSDAELLLLDEPTNHLDIRSIEWLEQFLRETDKTVIVVSHDRFFLDRVSNRIIEVIAGEIEDYRGNYSDYLKQRTERLARREKQWQLQNEWIEKQEDYIRRNIAGQKTKQAQSRRKLFGESPASRKTEVGSHNREIPIHAGRTQWTLCISGARSVDWL
jgi:ATPase subunit of ABC transporter with duplicated ATPase domains